MNNDQIDQLFEDMIQLDQSDRNDLRKIQRISAVGFMQIESIQHALKYDEKELAVKQVEEYFERVQEILAKK